MFELLFNASGLTIRDDDDDDAARMFSIPRFSTRSRRRIDRIFAFCSSMLAAFIERECSGSCPVIFFLKIPALDVRKLVNEVSVTSCGCVGE